MPKVKRGTSELCFVPAVFSAGRRRVAGFAGGESSAAAGRRLAEAGAGAEVRLEAGRRTDVGVEGRAG